MSIKPGAYSPCRAVRPVEGANPFGVSNSGTECIELYIEIPVGEGETARMKWVGYFSDGALDFTYKNLKAMGHTFPDGDPLDLSGIGSKEFECVVVEEEYNGRTFTKIKYINEIRTRADRDDMRTRLAAKFMALKARDAMKSAACAAPAKENVNADADIPF